MDDNETLRWMLNTTAEQFSVNDFAEPYHSLVRAAYVILTFINIFGNGIMCYIILARKNLHTPQNYLLFNLSIADVVGAIGIYPYVFMEVHPRSQSDIEQAISCAVIRGQVIYFVSVGTSLATLCTISWNRYFAIRYPLMTRFHLSKSGSIKLAFGIWITIFLLSLPFWGYYKYSETEHVCIGKTVSLGYRIYGTFILVFTFILPVSFLLLSLVALQIVAKKSTTGLHETSFRRRSQRIERAEKVVMFLIINLIASWCPFLLYWSLKTFTGFFPEGDAGQVQRRKWARVTLLFSIMNGTLDPILFYIGSSKIRKETCVVFKSIWRRAESYVTHSSRSEDSEYSQTSRSGRSFKGRLRSTIRKNEGNHLNLAYSPSFYSNQVFTVISVKEQNEGKQDNENKPIDMVNNDDSKKL